MRITSLFTKVISTLFLVVFTCSVHAQAVCVQDGAMKDGKCEKVFSFPLSDALPSFHYKVVWDQDDKIRLDRIEIFKEGQDSPFQTISTKTYVTKLDFRSTDLGNDMFGYSVEMKVAFFTLLKSCADAIIHHSLDIRPSFFNRLIMSSETSLYP